VEYALRDIHKPMGVSSFITKDIPLGGAVAVADRAGD
jgi:hypothetical protein